MTADLPDESFAPPYGDEDVAALFGSAPAADTCAAVLTEARLVLAGVAGPLDAELWGSNVVASFGHGGEVTDAIVHAAERASSEESLGLLLVLGALARAGSADAAGAAAARLTARGIKEPAWAESLGVPTVGDCWQYADAAGQQEAVTMTFSYGQRGHVVSALLDLGQGGAVRNIWAGDSAGVLEQTRELARQDQAVAFGMVSPAVARVRLERAIAAGECPVQPEEVRSVASLRALLRARVAVLPGG